MLVYIMPPALISLRRGISRQRVEQIVFWETSMVEACGYCLVADSNRCSDAAFGRVSALGFDQRGAFGSARKSDGQADGVT